MKRNITVNIFGSLYPMDEDAYAMLNAYIANMRDYFSRQPDGKEIADDIEGRVAELMSELRQSGAEAISIEHVEEIINRVGKPEQLVEEEVDIKQEIPPIPKETTKKRLFRDPEHKILGGVFGGFGCFLGVDPIWLRLAYILVLFGLIVNVPDTIPVILLLISAYFVCWGSIPMASNPAERLQMKGEPVNLSNMCEEFLTSTREMLSSQSEFNKDGRFTDGVVSVLKWCVQALCILLVIVIFGIIIGNIVAFVCAVSAPWSNLRSIVGDNFPILIMLDSNPSWLIWVSMASVLILLILTLFLLAHFTLRLIGSARPLSKTLRIICIIIWFIALIFCAASITKIISNVNIHYFPKHEQLRKKTKEERLTERKNSQKEHLQEAGWIIVRDNNIQNYSNNGEHYSGDKDLNYLDAGMQHAGLGMEYEVERIQKLAPGTYTLSAKGRTNGNGAEIFAVDAKGNRLSANIPVCGNIGGNVWKNAQLTLAEDTANILPNRNYLEHLAEVNYSKGYGWSEIKIENITVGPDSTLRYGVTNVSPTQTWDGTWLSATSFEIQRQE